MAKVKRLKPRGDAARSTGIFVGRNDISTWLPDSQHRVDWNELTPFPDNFTLVPHLKEDRKVALREDLIQQGVLEPFHVVYRDDALQVVSGNERLLLIQAMTGAERQRCETIPVIFKQFDSAEEIANHVIQVNANRKDVQYPPPERLSRVFPPAKHPILYEDLRGRVAEELRAEQTEARRRAAEVLGWSVTYLEKKVLPRVRKAGPAPKKPPRKMLPAEKLERSISAQHARLKGRQRTAFKKRLQDFINSL